MPEGVEGLRVWFLEQAEKPLFLAVEVVLALGFLALIDGGLSGAPPLLMWFLNCRQCAHSCMLVAALAR